VDHEGKTSDDLILSRWVMEFQRGELEILYTPKHGSWLNIGEIEPSDPQRQCLDRRIADKANLERETAAWEAARNAASTTVDWWFSADNVQIKLRKLDPSFHD
jgi:hypothetical protein